MIDVKNLTRETILGDPVFDTLLAMDDGIAQAKLLVELSDMAKALGVKSKFETLYKAYKKEYDKKSKQSEQYIEYPSSNQLTCFNVPRQYTELECGSWICDKNGVRAVDGNGFELTVCHHPILPVERLISVETGKEKVKLIYKERHEWKELIVDKLTIADSNKIVPLASHSIDVNSNNAKALMKFLLDILNLNINTIPVRMSTCKLGWVKGEFVPYTDEYEFDGEQKFRDVYNSLNPSGNEEKWLNLVRSIRKTERFEPKIALAGVLASPLLELLNALPFVVNLWGTTGKGKTVTSMLATSVWADPSENAYMADAKSTVTALEFRLDVLNSLPMIIDDMSQIKDKCDGDFSGLVYMLCSGKGKDRSNTSLGLNRSTSWKNVILTNYEHSLVTETMQGGAVNRIIDVETADGYIYANGNAVVELIRKNYGFAGKRFLEVIESVGIERIKEIQKDYYSRIMTKAKEQGVEKEEKQMLPMSILLTADSLATDYIFKDGVYMDFDFCVDLLKNRGEVSENERAYEYIMSEIQINIQKFKPDVTGVYRGEVWGLLEDGYAIIVTNVFNSFMKKCGFSSNSFLSWAKKQGLLAHEGDRNTKRKRLSGSTSRCYYLKLPADMEADKKDGLTEDNNGFVTIPENMQEELPFLM